MREDRADRVFRQPLQMSGRRDQNKIRGVPFGSGILHPRETTGVYGAARSEGPEDIEQKSIDVLVRYCSGDLSITEKMAEGTLQSRDLGRKLTELFSNSNSVAGCSRGVDDEACGIRRQRIAFEFESSFILTGGSQWPPFGIEFSEKTGNSFT